MNKKFTIILFILLLVFLFFRPKYSGYGQNCSCIGFKQNRVDKSHLNIVDPDTLKPLMRGTEIITTICYGIPYRCELNTGIEILDPSLDVE